jgi:nitric oxide reductase NorE protein
MPGLEGFWVLIGGDLAIFTLLFVSYLAARSAHPGAFAAASHLLDQDRGGLNTLVLVTSSSAVARALAHLRRDDVPRARRWLGVGIGGGLVFVVLKVQEYAAGHGSSASTFFDYYYALTGLHLAHVVVGTALLLGCWLRLRRPSGSLSGFESIACFWHLVDALWIVIFPLLYLIG